MNLVPIDTGGTPTGPVGGDASPGGGFAALMNGLMAGDTQIVPMFEVTTGEQLPEEAGAADGDDVEDAVVILEFVGTPPSGLTIPGLPAEATPAASGATTFDPIEQTGEVTAVSQSGLDLTGLPRDGQIDPADDGALATIHPISRDLVAGAVAAAGEAVDTAPLRPGSPESVSTTEPSVTEPAKTVAPAPPASADTPRPTSIAPVDADAPTTSHVPIDEAAGLVSDDAPVGHTPEVVAEVETEESAATTPPANLRTGGAITQPVMVGVARRVEEAIAALATKPDPKVVTLQLDELDGLRLTVALRSDGIHLSSSGDAALTTDIERALATRGFDMAPGRERGRQGSDQDTDDGWRPQPATSGRQPRTNPSGIRL